MLSVFIQNREKAISGVTYGTWVELPMHDEELAQIFHSIGIETIEYGTPYEKDYHVKYGNIRNEPQELRDYMTAEYNTEIKNLGKFFGNNEDIRELNTLAKELLLLAPEDRNKFAAVLECSESFQTSELIALTRNLEKYHFYEDIKDAHSFGVFYCDKKLELHNLSEALLNHIDYEGFGKELAKKKGGVFTEYGYIQRTDGQYMSYHVDINFISQKEKEQPFKFFSALVASVNTDEAIWIEFPATEEKIRESLQEIGVSLDNPETFLIFNTLSDIRGLRACVSDDTNLLQLNCLCDCLKQSETENSTNIFVFESVIEDNYKMGLPYLIDVTHNFECFEVFPGVENLKDLGEWLVYETHKQPEPDNPENDTAFEEIGQAYHEKQKGDFTFHGYLINTGTPFIPAYEMIPNMPPRSESRQQQAEQEAILSVNVMSTTIKYYGTPTTDNKNIYIHMPMTQEELSSAFSQIGADYDDYNSYMYNRYKTSVSALDPHIGNLFSYMPEANYLAKCISNLNENDRQKFEAIIGAQSELTVAKAINFALEMDCYAPFPDIKNLEDLGKRLVNDGIRETPTENPTAQEYEEIGAEYQAQRGGYFTSMGFIKQTDYPTEQSYTDPEDIPKQDNAGPAMKMI